MNGLDSKMSNKLDILTYLLAPKFDTFVLIDGSH